MICNLEDERLTYVYILGFHFCKSDNKLNSMEEMQLLSTTMSTAGHVSDGLLLSSTFVVKVCDGFCLTNLFLCVSSVFVH